MSFKDFLQENSTDNAKKTLDAILGTLKKVDKPDASMLKMANGINDYFKKEGSFSPDQAKWIFNTSQSLFH